MAHTSSDHTFSWGKINRWSMAGLFQLVDKSPHLSWHEGNNHRTSSQNDRRISWVFLSSTLHHMGLLPDTYNKMLRMCRECREHFLRHRLQRKHLSSDPGMHHGTGVTHVSWCMSGSLTSGGGSKRPGIPGACATRNFTYLVRGPWFIREGLFWSDYIISPRRIHVMHLPIFD